MITAADVATMKSVSRTTVYAAVKAGKLPYRKSGSIYLIRLRDAERWEPERRGPKAGWKKARKQATE